jgi:hypothetical protein
MLIGMAHHSPILRNGSTKLAHLLFPLAFQKKPVTLVVGSQTPVGEGQVVNGGEKKWLCQ